MNKAIDIELTAAICEKCGISADRAAKELKAAKVASKTTGLTLLFILALSKQKALRGLSI